MLSLKDKIKGKAEAIRAVAEVLEEKVTPKAKRLKGLKVGKIKKLNKKNEY